MNPLRPHVVINHESFGSRKLKLDMNAIAEIEGVLGEAVFGAEDNVLKRMRAGKGNIRYVRALLWGSMLDEYPDVTLQEVGKLMSTAALPEIMDGVGKALKLFFQTQGIPVPEEAVVNAEKPLTTAPNGLASGPSPDTTLN